MYLFKVKITKLPKARENAGDQVMIGFRFTSNWSRELCDFFNQSQSDVKQNHCNSGLLSTINYKLLYFVKFLWSEIYFLVIFENSITLIVHGLASMRLSRFKDSTSFPLLNQKQHLFCPM